MGSNAFLDIAIGLVLMYLVLSLIGTVINEFWSTVFKARAKTLQSAIPQIVDDSKLLQDFYNHGLIDSTNKVAAGDHASYFSGQTFAMAVIGSLDPTKPIPGFADVEGAIKNLPDSNIRDVLLSQLSTAKGDLDTLRKGLAGYFDSVMDRVSGVYKQRLKWISFFVGLGIVGVLNADTVAVGTALWNDSSLRAQMVESAKSLTGSDLDKICNDPTANDAGKKLHCLENEIRPLPLGWSKSAQPAGGWAWFWKAIGILLSALAVSLGAPFWFDLLSKFVNIRGSGPPPERSTTA